MQDSFCFEYVRCQFELWKPEPVTCYEGKMPVLIAQLGKVRRRLSRQLKPQGLFYLLDCCGHVVHNQPNMVNIKNISEDKISRRFVGNVIPGDEFQDATLRNGTINGAALGTTKMELVPSIRMP